MRPPPGTTPRTSRRLWLRRVADLASGLCGVSAALSFEASGQLLASQRWVEEVTHEPYQFRSDFLLSELPDLVSELVDLEDTIESLLNVECVHEKPITVYLFRSRSRYVEYLAVRQPDGLKRQALFVPGPDTSRVYVYRGAEMETDLRHECTHALLHQALPYLPLWLDEGLAEYFEVPAALREQGLEHGRSLRWATRLGWRPHVTQLAAKRSLREFAGKDYRDAWGVVHYLLHGPDSAREALQTYLAEIFSGAAPTPLTTLLTNAVGDYEREIARHFQAS